MVPALTTTDGRTLAYLELGSGPTLICHPGGPGIPAEIFDDLAGLDGRTLAQGAAAPDETIWIPEKEQNLVYRIDPAKQRVIDSFPAGPGAYVTLRAHGSMWVTSYAGRDVRRFSP